jgi:hypothetical protein
MKVLMNRRASIELIIGECHARRIEIAVSPARQAFDNREFAGIDEGHARFYVKSGGFRASRKLVINYEVGIPGSKSAYLAILELPVGTQRQEGLLILWRRKNLTAVSRT